MELEHKLKIKRIVYLSPVVAVQKHHLLYAVLLSSTGGCPYVMYDLL